MWQQEGWHEVVYYTGEHNKSFCKLKAVRLKTLQSFLLSLSLSEPQRFLNSSFPSPTHSAHGLKDHDSHKGFAAAVKWKASWKLTSSGTSFECYISIMGSIFVSAAKQRPFFLLTSVLLLKDVAWIESGLWNLSAVQIVTERLHATFKTRSIFCVSSGLGGSVKICRCVYVWNVVPHQNWSMERFHFQG